MCCFQFSWVMIFIFSSPTSPSRSTCDWTTLKLIDTTKRSWCRNMFLHENFVNSLIMHSTGWMSSTVQLEVSWIFCMFYTILILLWAEWLVVVMEEYCSRQCVCWMKHWNMILSWIWRGTQQHIIINYFLKNSKLCSDSSWLQVKSTCGSWQIIRSNKSAWWSLH